jgi:hypothetical protein
MQHIANAVGYKFKVRFAGEGARGASLRRLREILHTATMRSGKLVRIKRGAHFTPEAKPAEPRPRVRWPGRGSYRGQAALMTLRKTGCTQPTIERFIMGVDIRPDKAKRLEAACEKYGLDPAALRRLRPFN